MHRKKALGLVLVHLPCLLLREHCSDFSIQLQAILSQNSCFAADNYQQTLTGTSVIAQQVKPQPALQASHVSNASSPDSSLLMKTLALSNAPGKATENSPGAQVVVTHMGDWMELWAPDFDLTKPNIL